MRNYLILIFLFCVLHNIDSQSVTSHIHIDQFGYLPTSDKVTVISDPINGYNNIQSYSPGNTMQVIDVNTNQSVFSGSPTIWNSGNTHAQSGDKGWWFDFSAVTALGTYYILDVENNTKSYDFEIAEDIYLDVLKAATKMFYYNRCNAPKEAPYAEANWVDGDNFNNALQDSFCRYISDQGNVALERELSGGWFDAGDYNKYVTFAAKPIHQLLYAYQESPVIFADNWNIPESGNNIPDLIDEVKWELDWLQKMINSDGSVILKMGSQSHAENEHSPPSANTDGRYYGPTCTSASIASAGMLAHAALVLQDFPELAVYTDSLVAKAIDCFDYALDFINNNTLEIDCDDGSIVAGDADWDVDTQKKKAVLAAIYLWELTGTSSYHNYVINNVTDIEFIATNWLGSATNSELEALLHYATLPGANQGVIDDLYNSITPHISQDWNDFFGMNDQDLYRSYMPDWAYGWGSNQAKADFALLNRIIKNYNLNPSENSSYTQKEEEHIHYFHGVNPQNIVYLTNMYALGGDNCANEVFHAWFADGTDYDHALNSPKGPAPGFVPGGPNQNYSIDSNTPPYDQPSQKAYLDFNDGYPNDAWEITEPAIYYQAVYLRLIAGYANDICSNKTKLFVDHTATGLNDGTTWQNGFTSLSDAMDDVCLTDQDTIFISAGTYIPNTTDRESSYNFDKEIVLKGGYSNGGTIYNPELYETILSGNIGKSTIPSDNLYHVVTTAGSSSPSLINITISNGYANGLLENAKGPAIYSTTPLILDNVKVSSNTGPTGDNGVYIKSPTQLTIKNGGLIIENNSNF